MTVTDAAVSALDPRLGLAGATFLRAAARAPERPALEVEGEVLSYADLRARALTLAAGLRAHRQAGSGSTSGSDSGPALSAALVGRSASGFASILGILCSGHGYVPMLPSLPPARIVLMLERAEVTELVVDAAGAKLLDEVLTAVGRDLTVVLAECVTETETETQDQAELQARHPRHRFVGAPELAAAPAFDPASVEVSPDAMAYLLFTSGSTGEPKGVMVAHRNVTRFLDVVIERYGLDENDRFSHLFEITFDLSVFDLFATWAVGGCLCVPNARQRMLPTSYVVDAGLTVWFSVPSAALLMKQMRALDPGVFPNLRLVLFCGEALPLGLAEAFAEAAPTAVVENIYGPTELTLACTHYRWRPDSPAECENEVVPIGDPFIGMRAKVVDPELAEVGPGETGELLMTGPQRALGYYNDPAKTAAAFMVPPGETELFYRTGDRVRRPASPDAPMTFLGRVDSQIKLHGYRVELGEIEAVLARAAGVDAAVALGWPKAPGGARGVVGFVAPLPESATAANLDVDAVLDQLALELPRYMVPSELRVLPAFPLNQNGKIDRKALLAVLAAEDE